jgi:exodeoxyribonuclease V beta subunit
MNELDHLHVELVGRNLIEASAGTGKTYAIACLYLRLLVENNLMPEQILVVTYTEAATEELRGRIRSRIREALDVFEGAEPKDLFMEGLFSNVSGKGPGKGESRQRLDRALKSFDLAAIFTIHGFCLRALQDNAFESGSLYDTDLVTDQSELLQEVVDDFWRRHFFADSAPLLGYALRNKFTPDYFITFLKGMLGNPELQILPAFDLDQLSTIGQECQQAFVYVKKMWQEHNEQIKLLIVDDKGLSRAKGAYHKDLLPPIFAAMDAYTSADNPYDIFADFEKLCASGILKGKKPTGASICHPFFDLCEELLLKVTKRFLVFRSELLAFARERLPGRKRERNIRFFDDLMTDLFDALHGPRGGEFAASLNQKYRAALIDEFQDTDPVQYDIFRKIYAETLSPLFLIGDPKQAIYSFRGADIFAYLQAASDVAVDKQFTLTSNYRSTPGLLSAFNTVFSNDMNPFVFNQITYYQVNSGKGEDYDPLTLDGTDIAPLQVWYLPAGVDGKDCNVGRANKEIPASVAAEIARLLKDGQEGRAHIDGRSVVPEDIAVIVRSHRQAGYIQDALRTLGIPSVMRSDKSIFTTDEALEVCKLLSALADPGSESKIRAVLVTGIFALSGDVIAHLLDNELLWEEWLIKFREYHQEWLEQGFMVMIQTLMSRECVRGRLLQRPNGERILTNLLHCFEILHSACHQRGLGVEGLVSWFGERVSGEEAAEEYQIRLETDEKAVKILTVHVSKGLEFPIVFCPFLWGGIRSDDEIVTFHDGFKIMKDFGSADKARHRIIAQKESLAENLRLLYVAITRAKFRCYLVGGKIVDVTGRNRPETSPLAYLFHSSEGTRASEDLVGTLAREVKKLPAEKMVEQLEVVAGLKGGVLSISPLPAAEDAPLYVPLQVDGTRLQCRTFSGVIERSWRVSSFTSFAAHDVAVVELPDRDDTGTGEAAPAVAANVQEPQGMSIFTFPRGAHAGIFLHEIFEKLDFTDHASQRNSDLVVECLKKHGFKGEWLPYISCMVENVLTARLKVPEGFLSLSELSKGSWLAELEFFFPLKFVTSSILRGILNKWSRQHTALDLLSFSRAIKFKPSEGIVRGFIDMVFEHGGKFYLVDWKSNHLGYRITDYDRETLKSAMVQNLYPLQYLLYTVALNRYLSLRVKEYNYTTHFGGVLYVFLRGVDKKCGDEFGFFRDIPPAEMINDLTECLIQAGG